MLRQNSVCLGTFGYLFVVATYPGIHMCRGKAQEEDAAADYTFCVGKRTAVLMRKKQSKIGNMQGRMVRREEFGKDGSLADRADMPVG